jgi:hypothetical protein
MSIGLSIYYVRGVYFRKRVAVSQKKGEGTRQNNWSKG